MVKVSSRKKSKNTLGAEGSPFYLRINIWKIPYTVFCSPYSRGYKKNASLAQSLAKFYIMIGNVFSYTIIFFHGIIIIIYVLQF